MKDTRAVVYARVSGKHQEDNESLDAQQRICKEYASRNGLDVVEVIKDVMTGTTLARRGLTRVREIFKQGGASHFIFWTADRASRDIVDDIQLERELKKAGVTVHNAKAGRAYGDTAEDDFMRNIERSVSQYERQRILDRTEMGRREKAMKGQMLGLGPAPYGYTRTGEKKDVHLAVNEAEAGVVRNIFAWYTSGVNTRGIIAMLKEQGIPSPGDARGITRKREWANWAPSSLYNILRHPVYKGTWPNFRFKKVDGKLVKRDQSEWSYVEVPAIVDTPTWMAAQHRLQAGRDMAPRNTKHEYLLAKRIKCFCGYGCRGRAIYRRKDGQPTMYYCCHGRSKWQTARECDMPYVRADKLDAQVWEWMEGHLLNPGKLQADLQQQREAQAAQAAQRDQDLGHLLAARQEVEDELARLVDLYLKKVIKDTRVLERKQVELEDRKAKLTERIERLEAQEELGLTPGAIQTIMDLAAEMKQMKLRAEHASFDDKRFLLEVFNVQVRLERLLDGHLEAVVESRFPVDRLPIVSKAS